MQYTLGRRSVHQHAHELLACCLRLADYSETCPVRAMLHVLFAACARLCSLAAAALSLRSAPSRETVRKAWLAALPGRGELLRRLNRALVADVPRHLLRQPRRVAINLTLIPYHGLPMLDEPEVYRSKAKDGTSHFHAYFYCRGSLQTRGKRVWEAPARKVGIPDEMLGSPR